MKLMRSAKSGVESLLWESLAVPVGGGVAVSPWKDSNGVWQSG
jgi:hypothetical protein